MPILIGLFITTLVLQLGVNTISPILTLYVRQLSNNSSNALFVSGVIVSAAGLSAVFSSPILGRIGDRFGSEKVLVIGLIMSLLCYVPMGFVHSTFQLGMLRFFLGFSTGALMPSINTIIGKISPTEGVSRIYSYNVTFQNFGQVLGPLVGSTVAQAFDYSAVFVATGCFVIFNICLSLFNFRKTIFTKNTIQ